MRSFDARPPRFGGAPFLQQTDVPAPSLETIVCVSTINNSLGCETAVFLRNEVLWREYHMPSQDLGARHEQVVAVIRDGSLDLFAELSKTRRKQREQSTREGA